MRKKNTINTRPIFRIRSKKEKSALGRGYVNIRLIFALQWKHNLDEIINIFARKHSRRIELIED